MFRMKSKNYILVILCLLAFAACDKEDNNVPKTDDDVNQWIERIMRDHYLWNTELPNKNTLDFTQEPEVFFKALLSDKDGKDISGVHYPFSSLEKATTTKSIMNTNDSYGFDFATTNVQSGSNVYKAAIIIYVLKDSPAQEAGLKRGDWIIGVNGSLGTIQDYEMLRSGASVSLQLARYDDKQQALVQANAVTIGASRVVEDTPFLKDSIYTYGNKRIGYLMYNHFVTGPDGYSDDSYDVYLKQLFEKFKRQQVSEFVLDMRYNGGGNLVCAQLLASLLVQSEYLGQPFCKIEYNEKNKNSNRSMPFLTKSEVESGNLGLNRLYVLVGSTTASASELVINTLKPYLGESNVRLIGLQTLGKTVGMNVYDESDKYGWILSPVSFRIYNKDGKAEYEDGFVPDIYLNEFEWDLAEFGETDDPLLARAISEITGQSVLKSSRPATGRNALKIVYPSKSGLKANMFIVQE